MNLSDIFNSIQAVFSKALSAIKFKTISEESIRAQIEDARAELNIADHAFQSLGLKTKGNKDFDDMLLRIMDIVKRNEKVYKFVGKDAVECLSHIPADLKGPARSLGYFKAVGRTSQTMQRLLNELEENVEAILANKEGIIINDLQISQALYFGALESVRIYTNMMIYLIVVFSGVLGMSSLSSQSINKYILEYIVKYYSTYVELINKLCALGNAPIITTMISNVKKGGVDVKLSNNAVVNRRLTADQIGSENIFFKIFGLLLVPISWVGEMYIDVRHVYYERMKDRKKWLEAHVANIKLAMEDIDPNDPEYLKNQKIVAFYDDKISDLDKKIEKYNND